MKNGFLQWLWLPVDVMRLTIDVWCLSIGMLSHRIQFGSREQLCSFCRGGDTGRSPRPLPPRLMAYRNLWVVSWLMPCVRSMVTPRRRRVVPGCHNEGGYIAMRLWVLLVAVALTSAWILLVLFLLRGT